MKTVQESAPAASSMRSPFPPGTVVACWAIYDLANTIFSAIVITRYFIPYMDERQVGKMWIALATIASMFAAGVASPYAGALMDRVGKGRLLLFFSTLACVAFTAVLGLPLPNPSLLAAYVAANFFYNVALVFYNAFLPHLAPPERQGKVSGLGVGVGYLGILPAIFLAAELRRIWNSDAVVFPFAAALFLALSIPALVTLPRIAPSPQRFPASPFRQLLHNARDIWRKREARLFFIGNFLCTDVLNALILWIFVYVAVVFRFDDSTQDRYQAGMVISNVLSSFIAGWLSDRFTARKAFLFSAVCLLLALAAAGLTTSGAFLFWTTIPLAGFGLGGIWTAGRKLLFSLSPPERLGEYSGFYGLTGKVSAFTTLIYAAVATFTLGGANAHRAAILSLMVPVAAGIWFIALLRDPAERRSRPGAGSP